MESNQAWAVSAFPSYSSGHLMRISVIFELVAEGAVGSWFDMAVATGNEGSFVTEEDKGKASSFVRDTSPTQTYSFLPASWAGDTHKETDVLPIGDQEEKGKGLLNRCTVSLGTMQVLRAKYLADKGPY